MCKKVKLLLWEFKRKKGEFKRQYKKYREKFIRGMNTLLEEKN